MNGKRNGGYRQLAKFTPAGSAVVDNATQAAGSCLTILSRVKATVYGARLFKGHSMFGFTMEEDEERYALIFNTITFGVNDGTAIHLVLDKESGGSIALRAIGVDGTESGCDVTELPKFQHMADIARGMATEELSDEPDQESEYPRAESFEDLCNAIQDEVMPEAVSEMTPQQAIDEIADSFAGENSDILLDICFESITQLVDARTWHGSHDSLSVFIECEDLESVLQQAFPDDALDHIPIDSLRVNVNFLDSVIVVTSEQQVSGIDGVSASNYDASDIVNDIQEFKTEAMKLAREQVKEEVAAKEELEKQTLLDYSTRAISKINEQIAERIANELVTRSFIELAIRETAELMESDPEVDYGLDSYTISVFGADLPFYLYGIDSQEDLYRSITRVDFEIDIPENIIAVNAYTSVALGVSETGYIIGDDAQYIIEKILAENKEDLTAEDIANNEASLVAQFIVADGFSHILDKIENAPVIYNPERLQDSVVLTREINELYKPDREYTSVHISAGEPNHVTVLVTLHNGARGAYSIRQNTMYPATVNAVARNASWRRCLEESIE